MKKEIKNIGLLLQLIISVSVVIIGIISIFVSEFILGLQILLFLTMLIMSYNNEKIFKRKYLTIIYLIFSVVLLISVIMEML